MIQVDGGTDAERRRSIHESDSGATSPIGRPPLRLSKAAGIRADDARDRDGVFAVRHLIGQRATQRPQSAVGGGSASTSDVVERAVHRGGEAFSDDLLDVELAEVRGDALFVTTPSAMPFDGVVAPLVVCGKAKAFERPVADVANKSMETRGRIGTDARLRAGDVCGERYRTQPAEYSDNRSMHDMNVGVTTERGN